ncbi:MAG TPA: TMEM165/GDT1 family protein, partial [Acidimicrobiales bacterium]|nr:TMEM165/GDT1 family protein [Acidimicrobiales bacterium]
MNLSVLAITFGLIFVAELPDKTMIATIVLSSRYRPLPVWIGAALAMVFNSAVAVLAGRLLELLPHRWVQAVVAALFAGGALYLLVVKESAETREGEAKADKVRSGRRVALGAFTVIIVAELGDLTQILTANLVARYHNPWSVFVGSATALVTVMGVGVLGGRVLLRVLPLATIRTVAGIVLVGFAI